MIDGFGLIRSLTLGEFAMLGFLSIGVKVYNSLGVVGRHDIMGAKVQGTEDVDGDLAVETEALESDRRDFLATLVQGENLVMS